MKRPVLNSLFLSLIFLAIGLAMSGCQKSPINGDLDGQWQVMSVEPQTPETSSSLRQYMCFNLHTCQLAEYGVGAWTSGNIIYDKGKSLHMDFPYATSDLSISKLKHYGIYTNPVTFTVEHIDKNKLILRDGDVVVTLRKF